MAKQKKLGRPKTRPKNVKFIQAWFTPREIRALTKYCKANDVNKIQVIRKLVQENLVNESFLME